MQHVTLRVILMNLVYENTACNNEVVKKPFSLNFPNRAQKQLLKKGCQVHYLFMLLRPSQRSTPLPFAPTSLGRYVIFLF